MNLIVMHRILSRITSLLCVYIKVFIVFQARIAISKLSSWRLKFWWYRVSIVSYISAGYLVYLRTGVLARKLWNAPYVYPLFQASILITRLTWTFLMNWIFKNMFIYWSLLDSLLVYSKSSPPHTKNQVGFWTHSTLRNVWRISTRTLNSTNRIYTASLTFDYVSLICR